ncbi:hypothetical protein HDZ31DRAFT_59606 [Schizophyllum fasciatum]
MSLRLPRRLSQLRMENNRIFKIDGAFLTEEDFEMELSALKVLRRRGPSRASIELLQMPCPFRLSPLADLPRGWDSLTDLEVDIADEQIASSTAGLPSLRNLHIGLKDFDAQPSRLPSYCNSSDVLQHVDLVCMHVESAGRVLRWHRPASLQTSSGFLHHLCEAISEPCSKREIRKLRIQGSYSLSMERQSHKDLTMDDIAPLLNFRSLAHLAINADRTWALRDGDILALARALPPLRNLHLAYLTPIIRPQLRRPSPHMYTVVLDDVCPLRAPPGISGSIPQ